MGKVIRTASRRGARRMADVPADVRAQLAEGSCETVNLMEWLAADMPALARAVAAGTVNAKLGAALREAAELMVGRGVIDRMKIAGEAIAKSTRLGDAHFQQLAGHRSDLVRQWSCYAANDPSIRLSLEERLSATIPFAADANMSVREAAWMAFRPHLASSLTAGLALLERLAADGDENIRRFAVEVTRPRSVWGAHIEPLKRNPDLARSLLERVRSDPSRYVKLAVGNWLNDASKSRPEWVRDVCRSWGEADPHTTFIVRRGARTLSRSASQPGALL